MDVLYSKHIVSEIKTQAFTELDIISHTDTRVCLRAKGQGGFQEGISSSLYSSSLNYLVIIDHILFICGVC